MPSSNQNQKRMEAFLALIRYAENGKQDRSDAYTRLFGGGHFGGFHDHPRKDVQKGHLKSSASGAYGILKGTYDEAVAAHAAHDFYPDSQDAIAVWLITHRGHGAQWDVWEARLDIAFMKLDHIWTSLPGGGQQELTSDEAKKYFWSRLGEAVL